MTKYRGFTIEKSSTTVGPEIHGGERDRKMRIIRDANGHTLRNSRGDLPVITTDQKARELIDDEIARLERLSA